MPSSLKKKTKLNLTVPMMQPVDAPSTKTLGNHWAVITTWKQVRDNYGECLITSIYNAPRSGNLP